MQRPWVSKAEYIAAKKAEGTYKPKSSAYAARPLSYTGRKKVRAPVSYKPRAVNKAQVKKAAAARLTDCSNHYLASMIDPENVTGACIPAGFPIPSLKQHYKCYGTMVTNTNNGVGAIIFRLDIANNSTAVGASTDPALYVAATTPAMVGTAGTTYTPFNSEFTIAELASNNQYRVVSACLKVKYIGREDAMGGTMTWCEQSDHLTLAANTVGALRDRSTSSITRVSKEWQQINYSGPIESEDVEFTTNLTNGHSLPFIAVLVNAAVVAESLSFEWEAHINVEAVGVNALGKTETHSDAIGYAAVSGAVKSLIVDSSFMPTKESVSKLASNVASTLNTYAAPAAAAAGAAYSVYTGDMSGIVSGLGKYLAPDLMKFPTKRLGGG